MSNLAADDFEALTGRILPTAAMVEQWNTNSNPEVYKGLWNAATNTPSLSAGSPGPAGDYYIVSVGGTSTITGTSEIFGVGDRLISRGTKFDRIPYSSQGFATMVDGPLLFAMVDPAGWCLEATIDDNLKWPPVQLSAVAFSGDYNDINGAPLSPIETQASDMLLVIMDQSGNVISAIGVNGLRWPNLENQLIAAGISYFAEEVVDENGWVIRAMTEDGIVWPPAFNNFPDLADVARTGKYSDLQGIPEERWPNRYTNVYRLLPNFRRKMLGELGKTADDPVRIVIYGNSIMIRESGTTLGPVVPSAYPPTVETNSFAAYLYRALGTTIERPAYARFDSGRFTEAGTFATLSASATWDDGSRITRTRTSSSAGAAISFTVPVGKKAFNLIDRTATNGPTTVTITVAGGNGILLVKLPGTTSWVEANGATFSQREVDEGARRGNTIFQRRTYFKKVADVSVDVTITKDGTSDVFMYWGLEEVRGNNPYVQLINNARAGHKLSDLAAYWDDDITDQKPDLVLFELPLINMYIGTDAAGAQFSKDYSVNWVWDAIWGDRPGNTNSWNLKTASSNWANFEVLLIIPHMPRQSGVASYFNPDGSMVVSSAGNTISEVWSAVKALLVSKGDVPFVDMSAVFLDYADKNFGGNYYNAISGSSPAGATLTDDNVHPNNNGMREYAKAFCPILPINTF